MALSALAQIVEDLNLCRALNSFHKKVHPENILFSMIIQEKLIINCLGEVLWNMKGVRLEHQM